LTDPIWDRFIVHLMDRFESFVNDEVIAIPRRHVAHEGGKSSEHLWEASFNP